MAPVNQETQMFASRSLALGRNGSVFETEFNSYLEKERAAVKLQTKIGELLYDFGVELVLFRKTLVDTTPAQILRYCEYASAVSTKGDIDVFATAEAAELMAKCNLGAAKIDIGAVVADWKQVESDVTLEDFIKKEMAPFAREKQEPLTPRDVVLYGFGRIGRLAAREIILQSGMGQQLRLRAIVTRDKNPEDIVKRANLFVNDSVHGPFKGIVEHDIEEQTLCINGTTVKMISANAPEDIDYTAYGISNALVIDNTGVFKDKEALSRHLQAKGVARVLLTAPGKGVPNIVHGINQHTLSLDSDKIVSAASCTTNAICPILKLVEEKYGIVHGHIQSVHAFTNDQNLIDNMHKKNRRGRSAAVNMVITETGAGNAVPKIIPSLDSKLTANAVRVPTPNGSIAILNLQLAKDTSVEEINNVIREASIVGDLADQIHYSIDPELVTSDIIGNPCCAVYDSIATIVAKDGKNVVLFVKYDNEQGYNMQVIRLAKYISGVRRKSYVNSP